MNAPQYIVSQTFETLGEPCRSTHVTREAAEAAAATLRREIADMVADWEVPSTQDTHPTGYTHEIRAWSEAAEIAGIEYDENGELTTDSPSRWGAIAGARIAALAVSIETASAAV